MVSNYNKSINHGVRDKFKNNFSFKEVYISHPYINPDSVLNILELMQPEILGLRKLIVIEKNLFVFEYIYTTLFDKIWIKVIDNEVIVLEETEMKGDIEEFKFKFLEQLTKKIG